jgi:hypothetical protein
LKIQQPSQKRERKTLTHDRRLLTLYIITTVVQ